MIMVGMNGTSDGYVERLTLKDILAHLRLLV